MNPNTYNKVIGRIPKPPEQEEAGEKTPNLKEQWLQEKQTQHFLESLSKKRYEILDNVAAYAYNNGTVGPKQLAQLIEAEAIKAAIENYLETK